MRDLSAVFRRRSAKFRVPVPALLVDGRGGLAVGIVGGVLDGPEVGIEVAGLGFGNSGGMGEVDERAVGAGMGVGVGVEVGMGVGMVSVDTGPLVVEGEVEVEALFVRRGEEDLGARIVYFCDTVTFSATVETDLGFLSIRAVEGGGEDSTGCISTSVVTEEEVGARPELFTTGPIS